ncbi:MAG: 5'-nucleotidase C-terminal domain-containing protein, partial [Lysinibacillus sp.]
LASFVVRAENTSTSTEDVNVTIMHTNDAHANTQNYPKLATAVNEVRAENKDALLIDAGDVFSGTLFFNTFEGQADIALMNYIGYDVMTIGNHEFDLGSSPEGHKAFKEFVEAAKFPFVSSNVDMSKDKLLKGLFSDVMASKPEEGKIYNGMIKEVNGEKIGFFGLTTAETKDISSPGSVVFENYIEEANKAVKAFENMGVNKIVAISHIGYQDNPNVDNDVLLASNVEGIDVIVGGHSHDELAKPVVIDKNSKGEEQAPTVIVQAGEYLKKLGKLDVTFDAKGDVKAAEGELIDLSKKEDDAKAAEILKPYADGVKEVENEKVGLTLTQKLELPRTTNTEPTKLSVRNDDIILANLVTDGMLKKAREVAANMGNKKVVLALQNGGGIRSEIPAGEVTTGQIIKVLPFGNTLALMDVTGAELKAGFEIALKNAPLENGGFLHVAGGIVKYDVNKPAGERVVSIEYKEGDKLVAIEAEKTYTVATNAFTAKGGDGFDVFTKAYAEGRVTDLGLTDWINFRDHLLSLDEIPTTVEDRVQVVTGEEAPKPETKEVTIAEARQVGGGKEVQTTGIVTAILNNTIHMEDATGA